MRPRSTRRAVQAAILATLCVVLVAGASAADEARCASRIDASSAGELGYAIQLGRSERYCLASDLAAGGGWVPSEGRESQSYGDDAILRVEGSGVSIDLQHHALDARLRNLSGIETRCDPSTRRSCVRLEVRNGRVRSHTQYGIFSADLFPRGQRFASLLSDFQHRGSIDEHGAAFAAKLLKMRLEALEGLRGHFPMTEDVIEGVDVQAAFPGLDDVDFTPDIVAIGIQGGGNVIRGNTIEIENGQAGVYLFGPHQVIENNIIIFKGHAAAPSSAPIKLHLADGSIIRNNLILVEGLSGPHPASAISLIDSKDVVIENNRIYGTDVTWKDWDGRSSARESGTERLRVRPPSMDSRPGVH